MLFAFVAIIVICAILRLPAVKGFIGESIIRIVIGKNSDNTKKPQYVINNLVIERSPGKTSQIDHVVVNRNGVFVIETKNYSGRIYGTDTDREWTQVLNYGKTKNHFYNPVKQNLTHLYVVKELLPQDIPTDSVVVFLKGNIRYIKSQNVVTVLGLLRRINASVNTERSLSLDQIRSIYDTLKNADRSGDISTSDHVKNTNTVKKQIANNICPRCGGALILRHGKHGDFYGCSNYPNCRFTKTKDTD